MSEEIGRPLDELSEKVKKLNENISKVKNETFQFDKALRLDSGNVQALKGRFDSVQRSVALNTEKIKLLKQQQTQLRAEYNAGNISAQKYNSGMRSASSQIATAEKNLKAMNAELEKQNAIIAVSRIDSLTSKLSRLQTSAKTLSRTLLAVGAAMGAAMMTSVQYGDTLDDVSRKWQVSAEQLQLNNNLYDKITESPKGYEDTLKSLSSVMSTIARGRGAAYLKVLEKMGIAQKDLEGMNTAQLYDLVYQKLRTVTDETERAVLAQQLLGEKGLNLALVAGTDAEEIQKLNEEMQKHGLISTEEAAAAGKVADQMADVKIQAQAVLAKFREALYPMLLIIFQFIQETVLPTLQKIADWFTSIGPSGQKFILILAVVLILLPKILGIGKGILSLFKFLKVATLGQAAATGALGAASAPLAPMFLVIAGVLIIVISLMAVFSSSARKAKEDVASLTAQTSDLEEMYRNMDKNLAVSSYNLTENKQTKTSNVNVKVIAEGDTPISQDNAELLAKLISPDALDKLWGGRA